MCIGFPGKIVTLGSDGSAVVEIGGVQRTIRLDFLGEDASVGDYVISHAGYAIHRVDEQLAEERLATLNELMSHETY
ncbi:MAG: HypC/HybG/HupF family hydrogenase formation chaperone [Syntrophaceae bacterium]